MRCGHFYYNNQFLLNQRCTPFMVQFKKHLLFLSEIWVVANFMEYFQKTTRSKIKRQMDKFLAVIKSWNQKASKEKMAFFQKQIWMFANWKDPIKKKFAVPPYRQTCNRSHWNFIFTVVVNCGASLSENNTFFESEGEEKSHCSVQVCKASSSIVQVREDSMK